jgi:O-antigen/teichoic acid export membrane protein
VNGTPQETDPIGDPLRKIARGSLLSGVGAVVAAIGGVGLTLAVTRNFAPDLAGTFFAATTFFLIVGSLAQLGTDVGLVRYLSSHWATGQQDRIDQTLRIALVPVVIAATVCAAIMYLLAPDISGWVGNAAVFGETTSILRALAFFVPVVALYGALLAATRGRGSMRATVVVDSLFRTVAQPLLLIISVVVLHWGPTAAAVAWALPYVAGVVVCAVVLWRPSGRVRRGGSGAAGAGAPTVPSVRHRAEQVRGSGARAAQAGTSSVPSVRHKAGLARDFWSYTAARAVSGAVIMVWRRFDVLLVAALSGPADAAIYTAATRFLVVGSLAIQAVQLTVSPQLSRMFARHDVEGARQIYYTSTLWTMTFSWPLYIVCASAVSLVIPVFGARYSAGASSVVVLSAAMLIATACGSVDAVLLMSGRSLLSLANAVLTLAVNVGLDLVLIPRLGILGAATGWAISIALRNVLALIQIQKLMHMWAFSRYSAAVSAASVACFAVVPGLLSWAAAPNGWLVVSLMLGAAAYLTWAYQHRASLELDTFAAAFTRRKLAG